jgi:hypothetical protein
MRERDNFLANKWMPVTAGIITVIHGVLAIIAGILLIFTITTLSDIFGSGNWYGYFLPAGIILIGGVTVTGGIHAVTKKSWGLALTGAIVAFLMTLWSLEYWINIRDYWFSLNTLYGFAGLPAIIALVLTALSKNQFSR